jgi:L-alanine-DL-glutamate epimerase-like enolase superfamily enzyme
MKIRGVRCTPLAVPLAQAYHWRSGADTTANLVLVTVELDDGTSGYGEIVCQDPILAARAAEALAELVIGERATDVEALLQNVATRGRWRVTRRHTNQLLSGLEAACWDAAGKALQVPASTFLGGRVRTHVDFFGFIQGDAPPAVAAHAHDLATRGHSVLYLKVGLGRERDLARVEAVRAAIGEGPLLRVDANEAWDVPTALDAIRDFERFQVDWVEQPISGDNVPKLARIRREVATKIAADNAVYSPGELRTVLEADAADAVVLAPHESGGLWSFRRMAYLAETFGVPVNRKGYLESSISTFASLQALAGIPNLTSGNQLTHQLLAESLTTTGLELAQGLIEIPTEPGLGFELDEDAVARAHRRATTGH